MGPLVWSLLGLVGLVALVLLLGVRYIPNNRIGIVEKRWSLVKGSVRSGLLALNGEAGYQPEVLRGGLHFLLPVQYKVHVMPLVTIPQGKIGYVFARDGVPLEPTQVLASNETVHDVQDVVNFLRRGGQRGPQRRILREGTYAINLVQFVVITAEKVFSLPMSRDESAVIERMAHFINERGGFQPVVISNSEDLIGVVTVHDGPSLPSGEIIAPVVGENPLDAETYHNNFQDADHFLKAGGGRGRQYQVLVEGTYYINRLFATVELIPKTVIGVGMVGVVVSYTGKSGPDLSGQEYRHGELVAKGRRGVWDEGLLPGKYAFNSYAGKVLGVPTTNFILKWIRAEAGAHGFDENLAEVSLITKDAFEPRLPLSVVVHIDYRKAPLVVQRFGDIKRLVEQTLDPMVAAYFKNVAQTRTLIELLQERSAIQQQASDEMRAKFAHYNLELEEVLIGTPASVEGDTQIEVILAQLRSRQVAVEQIETYGRQEQAAVKERELREAEARAQMQTRLTESELDITVRTNQGKADYQRSLQEAAQIRAMAEAQAEKVARVGIAQALATEEQVRAYGGPQFQVTQEVLTRFAQAIETAGVDVVPRVMIGGGETGGGNIMEALLAMLLSDRLGVPVQAAAERSPAAEAERQKVLASLQTSGSAPATAR
ncbi:MAG: hypothetical protein IT204_13040 [Fimbriimonadaceae bacterium]|nr:hypothetical protein [Fimbriimonadaceae bacterium]